MQFTNQIYQRPCSAFVPKDGIHAIKRFRAGGDGFPSNTHGWRKRRDANQRSMVRRYNRGLEKKERQVAFKGRGERVDLPTFNLERVGSKSSRPVCCEFVLF